MFDVLRKLLFFVDRSTRLQAVGIAIVILIGTMLEVVGIGLVFPLVEAIADPSVLSDYEWVTFFLGEVNADNYNSVLLKISGLFFAVIVVKNALLLLSYILQGWFFAKNEALLARKLFSHYLNGDLRLLMTRNSSELINHVLSTTNSVYSNAMNGVITLAVEVVLTISVTIVLLMAEPKMTVSAIALMLVAVGLMYAFTRGPVAAWGEQSVEIRQKLLQILQQGLHSLKEVRVFGREPYIINRFSQDRWVLASLVAKISVIGNLPRLWIETVAVGGVILSISYVISSGSEATGLFSIFALFAAAIFRLIPSFNRMLMAMNSLRGGTYPVMKVYEDLNTFERPVAELEGQTDPLPFRESIELQKVSFYYPGTQTAAAVDIDLLIRSGETIGLVGISGAGKTTLADIVLGLLSPDSGRILVDGLDIAGSTRAWQKNLGYVPQTIYLTDDSLRRNIAFGIPDDEIDDNKVHSALKAAMLEELVESLPHGDETFLGDRGTRLSGGQRQRVGIARALYRDPKVLIFDEATSSLDSEAEFEVSAAIERLGRDKTIIIIAHRLSTLRSCDRLVLMSKGRIEDIGSFTTLQENNPTFKKLVALSKFEE